MLRNFLEERFYFSLLFLSLSVVSLANGQTQHRVLRASSSNNIFNQIRQQQQELQQQNNTIQLKSTEANEYTMVITTGENRDQEFNILFQLGGNQFWLTSEQCQIKDFSKNKKYICPSDNPCFNSATTAPKIGYFQDQQGSIMEGYYTRDIININDDLSTSFPFLTIVNSTFHSTAYTGYDGVMQFGPDKSTSLVNKLYEENKIPSNIFSLNINYEPIQTMMDVIYPDSELIIGGYNKNIISDGEYIYQHKLINADIWTIELKSASVNSKRILSEKRRAFLQLGSASITVPRQEFYNFQQQVSQFIDNCSVYADTVIYCKECEYSQIEDHPPFKLNFVDSNQKLQSILIPPEDYIQYAQGQCMYLIFKNNLDSISPSTNITDITADDWVLSDIFLKQVYGIYNYENSTVGFVRLGDNYDDEDSQDRSLDLMLAIIFVVIACGIGLYLFLDWKKKAQLQAQLEQEEQKALLVYQQLIQMETFNNINNNTSIV